MGWTDLITLKELSPELRELIMAGGGEGVISGNPIFIDSVYTKKVVATEQDQVEFEIPFEEFDTVNTYLDVKINSTWINPDRYSIEGSRVTLNDGVDIGTVVYFTIFSLAQVTPDGGYIQDVDIAETPQEIIVYDGSVIDEKVSAHNSSNEAHADIRELIKSKANQSYVDENFIKTLRIKGAVNEDFNNLIDVGIYRITNNNQPNKPPFEKVHYGILEVLAIPSSSAIKQIAYDLAYNETWIRSKASLNDAWTEWRKLATTDQIEVLESKLNWKPNNWKTDEALPSEYPNKQTVYFYTDSFGGLKNVNVETIKESNNFVKQSLFSSDGKELKYRLTKIGGTWGEWQEIATTSKINNLTLTNGWEAWSSDVGYKQVSKSGNIVSLLLFVKNKSATNLSPIVLPTEYRPLGSIAIHFVGQNKEIYLGGIRTDGQIYLDEQVPANVGVRLNCSWVV